MWRIASFSKFLAASSRKALPFFALLKKENNFEWTPEREAVFQDFKSYLLSPPILSKNEINSPLYLYLLVRDSVIAGILVLEYEKR